MDFNLTTYIRSEKAKQYGFLEQYSPPDDVVRSLRTLHNAVIVPIYNAYKGCNIIITSGYRCERLNKIVGGAANSQHKTGQAVDIVVYLHGVNITDKVFFYVRDNLIFDQLIWEKGDAKMPQWIHISYNAGSNRQQIIVNK